MSENLKFTPEGREKVRLTADGRTTLYTYADEDPSIPHGMRRVTLLENDPNHRADQEKDDD